MSEPAQAPPGWESMVAEGWWPSDQKDVEWVPVGKLLLPEAFVVGLAPPEPVSWRLWLSYSAIDGERVQLQQAVSLGGELITVLNELRRTWTIDQCAKFGMEQLVLRAANLAVGQARRDGHVEEVSDRLASLRRDLQAVRRVQVGRRSNRVDREHLQQVVEVYNRALADGRATGQAIQEEMRTTKATAARWVALAREVFPDEMPPVTRGRRKDLT